MNQKHIWIYDLDLRLIFPVCRIKWHPKQGQPQNTAPSVVHPSPADGMGMATGALHVSLCLGKELAVWFPQGANEPTASPSL